jgi:hypothetical protein
MTAADLRRYLKLGVLKEPGDWIVVPDDKGIFNTITSVDLDMNAKMCYNCIPLPLRVWRGAFALNQKG